jgi:DNA-binding NarL/FixJ family response regulator
VLVASSDRLAGESTAALLRSRAGWRVVGFESDGVAAVAMAARLRPDAVLVIGEVGRLGAGGLEREVRRRRPETIVVVVGGGNSSDTTFLPSRSTVQEVLDALASERTARVEKAPARGDGIALLKTLTRQELMVLRLLAEGLTQKEIAARRGMSQHTVRTHIQNLYAKLHCHNRVEVIHFANRHGVVGFGGSSS